LSNNLLGPKIFPWRNTVLILIGIVFIALFLINRSMDNKEVLGVAVDAEPEPLPIPTALDTNFENQVNKCFVPIAGIYGYNLRITSGFRTLEEQAMLYAQGREVEGHIVTYTLNGLHNFGYAVDVVDRFRGFEIDWDRLGRIGAYCGLQQGDEEYDEKVHFQHREKLSIADFIAGKRPSPLQLPCHIMEIRAQLDQPLTLSDLESCGAPKF
jgi:hypothetical protein